MGIRRLANIPRDGSFSFLCPKQTTQKTTRKGKGPLFLQKGTDTHPFWRNTWQCWFFISTLNKTPIPHFVLTFHSKAKIFLLAWTENEQCRLPTVASIACQDGHSDKGKEVPCLAVLTAQLNLIACYLSNAFLCFFSSFKTGVKCKPELKPFQLAAVGRLNFLLRAAWQKTWFMYLRQNAEGGWS